MNFFQELFEHLKNIYFYNSWFIWFLIAISGNIYIGQLPGANNPEQAKNASKVLSLILCNFDFYISNIKW